MRAKTVGRVEPEFGGATPPIDHPIRIHDKWYSVEWAETTKSCCNVWGKGRNKEFGEYFTIGVHDPRQRRIVIYKVSSSTPCG